MKQLTGYTISAAAIPSVMLAVFMAQAMRAEVPEPSYKTEYKMHVGASPETHWGMGAAKFAQLVKEKTGGRINVTPYYGGQLVREFKLNSADMVAMDAADLALESTINLARVVPELHIFSLPFFLGSFEDLDKLEEGETGRFIFDRLAYRGLMGLAWGENGFRQLTNNVRPVRTPEDLRGLRIRVVSDPVLLEMYTHLGAQTVQMSWPDTIKGFEKGEVDGMENPVTMLVAGEVDRHQSHLTIWNCAADPLIFFWSLNQWRGFPTEIQTAIVSAAREAARFQKALARAGLDGGTSLKILRKEFGYTNPVKDPLAHLRDKGMVVTVLSAEERRVFFEACRPVYDKWRAKIRPVHLIAATDLLQ
ncbi:MAG: TRAP transporter substrate-binding protein DctP [Kiritimatiellae bacterium]|nr:TRAP transporter substrate-binding protein DctP [Kiritimatiellia bacterium]